MPEPFLVAKAVDVSGAALGKSVSVVLKGLIVLGLIALIVWETYITLVKPHTNPTPTTAQKATYIYNVYVYPNRKGFSLLSWGTWHLFSKDSDYPLKPILYQQVVTDKPAEVK